MPGTDAVVVLDLFVEEPVLGTESRFFREAGIAFGHLTVMPIGDDRLPEPVRRRPDLLRRRFTEVHLPFDLEELKKGREYLSATVRMVFACDARAVSVSCTSSDETIEIRTFGIGREQLSYVLSPKADRAGFAPSAQLAVAVLETPTEPTLITGTIDAHVAFTHRQFGISIRKEAEPKRPLRFSLDILSGSYDLAGTE